MNTHALGDINYTRSTLQSVGTIIYQMLVPFVARTQKPNECVLNTKWVKKSTKSRDSNINRITLFKWNDCIIFQSSPSVGRMLMPSIFGFFVWTLMTEQQWPSVRVCVCVCAYILYLDTVHTWSNTFYVLFLNFEFSAIMHLAI